MASECYQKGKGLIYKHKPLKKAQSVDIAEGRSQYWEKNYENQTKLLLKQFDIMVNL